MTTEMKTNSASQMNLIQVGQMFIGEDEKALDDIILKYCVSIGLPMSLDSLKLKRKTTRNDVGKQIVIDKKTIGRFFRCSRRYKVDLEAQNNVNGKRQRKSLGTGCKFRFSILYEKDSENRMVGRIDTVSKEHNHAALTSDEPSKYQKFIQLPETSLSTLNIKQHLTSDEQHTKALDKESCLLMERTLVDVQLSKH